MGKAKKWKVTQSERNLSLPAQIDEARFAKKKDRIKLRDRTDEDEKYVDSKLSQRIIDQAHQQQLDLVEEFGGGCSVQGSSKRKVKPPPRKSKEEYPKLGGGGGGDEESDDEDEVETQGTDYCDKEVEVNPEDEQALNQFMNRNAVPGRTLADIIMEKINQKNKQLTEELSEAGTGVQMKELDPSVIELYKGVREVLSKYRSGKIPKAFKIVPLLRNWEQILYLTDPPCWTAAAVYQATRIFTANLKEKLAQRFFNLVLLPRVRDDISEFKRLNFHLYQALRKALFKPGAFMKGIILPLCENGDCTLREAVVISSILAKNSIPVLHSAAAMLKLAEMEYSGAASIFLRVFFDKKYALPYRVIDAVVFHFLRFISEKRQLPVLWHQAFLTFVQRYKEDISCEQKEELLKVMKIHSHPGITPEIRRELQDSISRGDNVRDELMDQVEEKVNIVIGVQ